MTNLICNHCKNELTVENIKNITFGRVYETTEFGIRDREVAFVWCNNCGESSMIEEHIGYELELDLEKTKKYTFKEVEYLLKNLSNIDKEKVRDCKFRISESYPDDDSGDVYNYITIFKDNTEIGKIDMIYHSNQWFNILTGEFETLDQEGYYSYTMKLNEQHNCNKTLQELKIYKHLTKEQKQQLEEYTFTNENKLEDAFFDDYTVWEYTADIIQDTNKIGKLTVTCGNKHGDTISLISDIAPEYEYIVKIEIDNKDYIELNKDYIECPKCHNKILRNYWLNVKYQGHNNYGDYEEDIYTGECPICGETIETDDLQLYIDSMEASETELQHYYKVIGNFGYNTFPFEDWDYSEICAADELTYIKNALDNLNDILNVKYLYNIYNIQAVQSNRIYDYNSGIITNIFHNTSYADFDIDSIKDCKFRVLDCSVLNDIVEENLFDTSIISLILQVIRNNKILGYINVEQQYPLDTTFTMFEVKKDSNKRLIELCKTYTSIYDIKEDTSIMLSKSRTDEFNTPVCKKCGQIFCDCNLKCKICGKIFCEHKY